MVYSSLPGLIMAGSTIGELGQFFLVIGRPFTVTLQTPAHVHHLRVLRDLNSRHIARASFTVPSRGTVGPVREMDKIRYLGDWHPGNVPVV